MRRAATRAKVARLCREGLPASLPLVVEKTSWALSRSRLATADAVHQRARTTRRNSSARGPCSEHNREAKLTRAADPERGQAACDGLTKIPPTKWLNSVSNLRVAPVNSPPCTSAGNQSPFP